MSYYKQFTVYDDLRGSLRLTTGNCQLSEICFQGAWRSWPFCERLPVGEEAREAFFQPNMPLTVSDVDDITAYKLYRPKFLALINSTLEGRTLWEKLQSGELRRDKIKALEDEISLIQSTLTMSLNGKRKHMENHDEQMAALTKQHTQLCADEIKWRGNEVAEAIADIRLYEFDDQRDIEHE